MTVDQFCDDCRSWTDHVSCWDTDLSLSDVNPMIAIHDAALAATREEPCSS